MRPVPPDAAELKRRVQETVAEHRSTLVGLAEALHADPELAFDEHRASDRCAELLEKAGFELERPLAGLATAFRAAAGHGELTVALCAELDALPGVGHACGHNLIAASALGAALGLAAVAEETACRVLVLGTPAEEGGGGKVLLLERGAFAGAHLALMVHPWPEDRLTARCLAVDHLQVTYTGREAHAAAAPWQGVNAGDAMVVAQVAIGLLRQHLEPGALVHGVVDSGGQAPNVVPQSATGRWMLRAPTLEALQALRPRIERCFEAGALATGCQLEIRPLAPTYSHMEPDQDLLRLWRANAEALGRRYPADDAGQEPPALSTDMANVSLALPAIHPLIGIDAGGACNHQPAFAAACVGPSAERALVDGALALAWTVVDAATDPGLRARLLAGQRQPLLPGAPPPPGSKA
jgi:amidohydrolase